MRFSLAKCVAGAAVAVALVSMAGCNQQKNTQEKFAAHPRVRVACAAEIEKYCANEPRKRRCLRQNTDKLGDACKAALAQRRGRRGGGGNDDNTGGND